MFPGKGFLLLFLAVFIGLVSSCAIIFPDRTAPKSADYTVLQLSSPWSKIPVGEDLNSVDALKADIAYENTGTGSIISLNSLCRKYNNASLEQLNTNLVRGIEDRKLIIQKETTVDGTKALDSKYSGNVDSVAVHIRTVVLVKNFCTYDFIHVTLPRHESKSNDSTFEQFLSSFKAKQ